MSQSESEKSQNSVNLLEKDTELFSVENPLHYHFVDLSDSKKSDDEEADKLLQKVEQDMDEQSTPESKPEKSWSFKRVGWQVLTFSTWSLELLYFTFLADTILKATDTGAEDMGVESSYLKIPALTFTLSAMLGYMVLGPVNLMGDLAGLEVSEEAASKAPRTTKEKEEKEEKKGVLPFESWQKRFSKLNLWGIAPIAFTSLSLSNIAALFDLSVLFTGKEASDDKTTQGLMWGFGTAFVFASVLYYMSFSGRRIKTHSDRFIRYLWDKVCKKHHPEQEPDETDESFAERSKEHFNVMMKLGEATFLAFSNIINRTLSTYYVLYAMQEGPLKDLPDEQKRALTVVAYLFTALGFYTAVFSRTTQVYDKFFDNQTQLELQALEDELERAPAVSPKQKPLDSDKVNESGSKDDDENNELLTKIAEKKGEIQEHRERAKHAILEDGDKIIPLLMASMKGFGIGLMASYFLGDDSPLANVLISTSIGVGITACSTYAQCLQIRHALSVKKIQTPEEKAAPLHSMDREQLMQQIEKDVCSGIKDKKDRTITRSDENLAKWQKIINIGSRTARLFSYYLFVVTAFGEVFPDFRSRFGFTLATGMPVSEAEFHVWEEVLKDSWNNLRTKQFVEWATRWVDPQDYQQANLLKKAFYNTLDLAKAFIFAKEDYQDIEQLKAVMDKIRQLKAEGEGLEMGELAASEEVNGEEEPSEEDKPKTLSKTQFQMSRLFCCRKAKPTAKDEEAHQPLMGDDSEKSRCVML